MLKNRIIKLQQELNQQITNQGDYDTIYRLSLELDQLIVEFYRVKSA
ncbi:aspartyl-phosphate phosphatase Spo0E family protein [Alkaliphilus serpentinus]|uniref:Spo0E family sporulation regulatory protein-aspartic acid phosphatase n=1 Tax=Alkaliphilus serpentinus TaxID=1482731 RepID=A0A833MFB6_9FIRM|nr:aspartyl-phosphate phosphatase Spo0E family protein [Alkaliphilus serpentinus]KAB3533203.1 Spo0E family sporulation regulatory protein-aspartic acid phosphatase [Alkaliphilus serpentinus]